ncbi:MAG: 16S rRNA (guanine(527)-N(7))-methyltransferase RsmG [Oleiphilaceae bacterium]|nr:16S rRNA (guanine(527)-N(7))-methyltransferase RsmG [Oleiphilaceae bacterium]
MSKSLWHDQLVTGLAEMHLMLSADQQARLLDFLGLLVKWNRAYNLTAVREPSEMVSRQLLDSLSLLPWLSSDALLDVGAGGGLPGIPLAIVRPDQRFTLLDSNSKKTRFLTQCVLELKLNNVDVVHGRAEDCEPGVGYTQISSRAFTALDKLVHWCGHLLTPAGHFLAMKGQFPDDEVQALPGSWRLKAHHALEVPGCAGERHLLIIDRDQDIGE